MSDNEKVYIDHLIKAYSEDKITGQPAKDSVLIERKNRPDVSVSCDHIRKHDATQVADWATDDLTFGTKTAEADIKRFHAVVEDKFTKMKKACRPKAPGS